MTQAHDRVTLTVLDAATGRPVSHWTCNQCEVVTIGRADECTVQICDPYVSRHHAEFRLQDEIWTLTSLGRNGVVVDNRLITQLAVPDTLVFRLGPDGPVLRFEVTRPQERSSQTLCSSPASIGLFELDADRLRAEVGVIESGDFFQNLQQRAAELRRQRAAVLQETREYKFQLPASDTDK
jgi:hypothetical protein